MWEKEGRTKIITWKILCVCVQSLSHIQLFTKTWAVACQSPLAIGFPRQEHWNGLPFLSPGGLPAHLLHRQVKSLPRRYPEKPLEESPEHFKCTLFVCCPKMVDITFTYLQYVVPSKSAGTQALLLCNTKPGENPKSLFRIFQLGKVQNILLVICIHLEAILSRAENLNPARNLKRGLPWWSSGGSSFHPWSGKIPLLKPASSGTCALQPEKPLQWEACTLQGEKSSAQQWRPNTTKRWHKNK